MAAWRMLGSVLVALTVAGTGRAETYPLTEAPLAGQYFRVRLHMKLTGKMPIKDTKLAGRELLGKPSLPTEDLIVKYVATVVEARRTNDWARRDSDRTVLVPVPTNRYLNR